MTSVERVLAYTKLEQERPKISGTPPPADWPPHGAILFRDVCLSYTKDENMVLKHISCCIEANEKVRCGLYGVFRLTS
jgi:ABC-type multidrug transport system fused ATPase/permease subunit